MSTDQHGERRRRRRAGAPAGPPPERSVEPAPQLEPAAPIAKAVAKKPRSTGHLHPHQHGDHHGERGLRDLVGGGRSQVGVSGALRARDVNRPTDEDLAAAERDVVLVRRHWKPPPS